MRNLCDSCSGLGCWTCKGAGFIDKKRVVEEPCSCGSLTWQMIGVDPFQGLELWQCMGCLEYVEVKIDQEIEP